VDGVVSERLADGPRRIPVARGALSDSVDEDEPAVGEEDPVAHNATLGEGLLVDPGGGEVGSHRHARRVGGVRGDVPGDDPLVGLQVGTSTLSSGASARTVR
jgi:hypothetical protein